MKPFSTGLTDPTLCTLAKKAVSDFVSFKLGNKVMTHFGNIYSFIIFMANLRWKNNKKEKDYAIWNLFVLELDFVAPHILKEYTNKQTT